ncbi:pyruvate kinase [Halorarius litoreus]|uniref:pyruvate kinase n=1 Tax=Halorarius litoreus TaxID=2962676 RepID=UPI0020CB8A95|nr:pyruvate kinase [Halorarius litoreus]
MRNAKIVCTLGPASNDSETISDLVEAGMSVARLNASHGTPEDRATVIDRIREVDATTDRTLAVMHDLPGPEIRTAPLDDPIYIETGSELRFVEGRTATPEEVGLSMSLDGVSEGDTVLLDDGRIETVVLGVDADGVRVRVEDGGKLSGRKGVNIPGVDLGLDIITDQDERELDLAAEKRVDFVAASFVRDAADVYRISEALEERGADIPVIAKIERADAVENLDGIIDAAFGVMVARGDLGVECPLEEVPLIQKRIIRRCREAGVPVITATEMLDSMVHERRPTRAEASDVANAVLDGTDAVMLSAETAVGDYPVRVVETMDRIVRDAEESDEYDELREQRVPTTEGSKTDALARSARFLARDVDATAVVAASESGYTVLKAAKYRPTVPILASTPHDRIRRKLALSSGVVPKHVPMSTGGADTVISSSVQAALDAGVAESGDTVVALAGMMTELEGVDTTNMLKVHVAAEILASGRSVVEGYASGPVYRVTSGDLTDVPDGAILVLSEAFDDELTGDLDSVAGVIDADARMTSYAAMVARELGIPMVGDAVLPESVDDGDEVTLDAQRGVVYEDTVGRGRR